MFEHNKVSLLGILDQVGWIWCARMSSGVLETYLKQLNRGQESLENKIEMCLCLSSDVWRFELLTVEKKHCEHKKQVVVDSAWGSTAQPSQNGMELERNDGKVPHVE